MTKNIAAGILRLFAILAIFSGIIILSYMFCQIRVVRGATYKPPFLDFVYPLTVSFWGLILYVLSPKLGTMVASEHNWNIPLPLGFSCNTALSNVGLGGTRCGGWTYVR